ncbi:MAG: glycerol dehydrogenase [Chloroflexi bacterium]|nr:glycerol dehydrogenase [Chloroflexota bacterium]
MSADFEYPLMDNAGDRLKAFSGKPLPEITLEAAADGELSSADLRIHRETLVMQAQTAREAGYIQLAGNLMRAAELTLVPNAEVLQIYDLLRPMRASYDQLIQLATHLEQSYDAVENGRFVREAAEAYRERNLLRE